MTTLDLKLKNSVESLLGKAVAKAQVADVSTVWLDNRLDAEIVSTVLSKEYKTNLEEEVVREPITEGMTREERRARKWVKTGLYIVYF